MFILRYPEMFYFNVIFVYGNIIDKIYFFTFVTISRGEREASLNTS